MPTLCCAKLYSLLVCSASNTHCKTSAPQATWAGSISGHQHVSAQQAFDSTTSTPPYNNSKSPGSLLSHCPRGKRLSLPVSLAIDPQRAPNLNKSRPQDHHKTRMLCTLLLKKSDRFGASYGLCNVLCGTMGLPQSMGVQLNC
jgi:hypothetical protein